MFGFGFCCCDGCEVLGDFNDTTQTAFEAHYELSADSSTPVWTKSVNDKDVLTFNGNASFKIIYPKAQYANDNIYLRVKPTGEFTKVTYRMEFGSESVEYIYEKISDSFYYPDGHWYVRKITACDCVLYDLDAMTCRNELSASASNFGIYLIRKDNKVYCYDYKADYYSTGYYGAAALDDSIKPDITVAIEGTDFTLDSPWITMYKPDKWWLRDYEESRKCELLINYSEKYNCQHPSGYEYPIRKSEKQGCPYPSGTCESLLYELALPVIPPVKLRLDGFEDVGSGVGGPCSNHTNTSTEGDSEQASTEVNGYGEKICYSDLNGKEIRAVSGYNCQIAFEKLPPYKRQTRNKCYRETWQTGFTHFIRNGDYSNTTGEITETSQDVLFDDVSYSCENSAPTMYLDINDSDKTVTIRASLFGYTYWSATVPLAEKDNKISLPDLNDVVLHCNSDDLEYGQPTVTIIVDNCPQFVPYNKDCLCCQSPLDSIAVHLSLGKHLHIGCDYTYTYEASYYTDPYYEYSLRETFQAPIDPTSNAATWQELDSLDLILQQCNLLPTEADGRFVDPEEDCDDCYGEYYVSPVFELAGLSGYAYVWKYYPNIVFLRLLGTLSPSLLTLPTGTYGDIVIIDSTAPNEPFDIAHCNPFASSYTLKKRIPNVYSWLDQNYNYSDSICSGGDYWGYPYYFGRTSTGGTVTWYHKDLPSSIKNYVDNNPPESGNWWDKYKASADIYLTFRAHVEALFND